MTPRVTEEDQVDDHARAAAVVASAPTAQIRGVMSSTAPGTRARNRAVPDAQPELSKGEPDIDPWARGPR